MEIKPLAQEHVAMPGNWASWIPDCLVAQPTRDGTVGCRGLLQEAVGDFSFNMVL